MCTIIALNGLREDYPVVFATNRDEVYARPSSGAIRLLSEPAVVGGQDLEAGGTWMGVSATGFFAGVTNQRSFATPRVAARSRGKLVMDVLRLGTTALAREHLAALEPQNYRDFNLMFGDSTGVWVAYGRGARGVVRQAKMPSGLHVLPNDELDSPEFPKCARADELLAPHTRAPWSRLRTALAATLADGQTAALAAPPDAPARFDDEMMRKLSALCVRTDRYGTRSSTIVALAPGRCGHFLYADGPPDQTPFRDVTPLLQDSQ